MIKTVKDIIDELNDLILSIGTALDAVSIAIFNLTATIANDPLNVDLICSLVQSLIDTLNALDTLVVSVTTVVTDILATLTAALSIPLVGGAVQIAIDGIELLIVGLPGLIDAVTAAK